METANKKIKCELYQDSMQNWKDIEGYEGLYQVSDLGNVRSVSHFANNNINGGQRYVKGRVLSPYRMPNGYMQVQLSKESNKHKKYIHRLVAEAFLTINDDSLEVNHINGDKADNNVKNLEWVTHKDNQIHMVKNHMTRKAKPVMRLSTGIVYDSLTEAEKRTGVDRHYISEYCKCGDDWRFC